MIVVVDSGIANVGSVASMLRKLGVKAIISSDPAEISRADKLILPGVGAFDAGMRQLTESGLVDSLNQAVLSDRRPILGICLGMHLMARSSEEGSLPGLGWLDADVLRFDFKNRSEAPQRVPHMGWNRIQPTAASPLFDDLEEDARFYFVHSYHVAAGKPELPIATTTYGYSFVSAVARDNIFGVQFHPEKSHRFGLTLLRNFAQRI